MHSVKVKRLKLLETIKKNRDAHRALFEKAQVGYRDQCILELDRMLEDARKGRPIRRAIALDEPIDQTKAYDRVIAMLEMSVEDVIVLDEHDFQCYVLDQWDWAAHVCATNTRYT